jgi:hypothetical protein
MNECIYCETGYRGSVLNWQSGLNDKLPDLARYAAELYKIKDLRFGSLWACRHCTQRFWVSSCETKLRAIPPKNEDTFTRWCSRPPILSREQRARVESLQPVEHHERYREVPASVRFSPLLDPCLAIIRLDREPNVLFCSDEHVRLATDIYSIQPSDYALPYDIRLATSKARFIETPGSDYIESEQTKVQSPMGYIFLIDGSESCFAYGAVRGADMRFPGAKRPLFSRFSRPTRVEFPRNLKTWVLAEP